MLNAIELQGRLVRDVEVKATNTGKTVATFAIAVERDTAERETDFINITAWNEAATFVSKYFRKGSLILVKGRLQTRSYEDRDGNKRTAFEVVSERLYFCGKNDGVTEATSATKPAPAPVASAFPAPSRLSEKEESALYEQSRIGGTSRPYAELEDDGELPF